MGGGLPGAGELGYKELLIGIGLLVAACLLYAYRRVVEDREPLVFQDLTPGLPPAGIPDIG